jgi:hypothetical protein
VHQVIHVFLVFQEDALIFKGVCLKDPLLHPTIVCHWYLIMRDLLLAVLKPNRIIRKRTDANCSSFHLGVFLGLSNRQGQRQTSTLSISRDNFRERKAKFNLETGRTTQM